MDLSDRQVRILAFIRTYLEEHNYPPTIREIGKAVGIPSTSVVKYNLERLQEKGHIERSEEVSRGLRLMNGPQLVPSSRAMPGDILRIPKLGMISAGSPIARGRSTGRPLCWRNAGSDQRPGAGRGQHLRPQVKGDSMIDALVHDGDWVIIKYQNTAQRGDMIVAWITDREETTLKYYYPEGAQVRLQPANPAYQPIYVPAEQFEIQGKVVAVVRQLG